LAGKNYFAKKYIRLKNDSKELRRLQVAKKYKLRRVRDACNLSSKSNRDLKFLIICKHPEVALFYTFRAGMGKMGYLSEIYRSEDTGL
jgi:hypothetical protein